MKKIIIVFLFLLGVPCSTILAQKSGNDGEQFGKTLNVGVGIGYYGYVGHSVPFFGMNYEFDVARNFTLAPFAGMYTYRNDYYWGDYYSIYRNYSYRETVIPVGVKASYYFDELLNAGSDWDFYAAGSLGFAFTSVTWDTGYMGDRKLTNGASPLFLNGHIGTEYHMNDNLGLFLDLSVGISTFGLAIHF